MSTLHDLKPAKGILLGLALSLVFWLILGLIVATAAQAAPTMSADPAVECDWNPHYDPAPFLQAHGASIMRLIVTAAHPNGVAKANGQPMLPSYARAIADEQQCVQRAQAEGYRVLISFQYMNNWTPAQVAGWFRQVLPLFPGLRYIGFGNEQDFAYSDFPAKGITRVCIRKETRQTTYEVVGTKTVTYYTRTKVYRTVRRHHHKARVPVTIRVRIKTKHHKHRWVLRNKTRRVRHTYRVYGTHVQATTTVARRTTCKTATLAQQYRLDYNATEPVIRSLEPQAEISFGNAYPLGQRFILNAYAFGGRPAGVSAIGITGYWLGAIPPLATFARSQGLQVWTPENNPCGPGGSPCMVPPTSWASRWNATTAEAPNWTIDDFYS